MDVVGQPRASAIGLGMAITRGVSCRDLALAGTMGRWPLSARRWLTTAPHELAAGDQITGRGPLVASSGQPLASRSAATPEDLFSTFTSQPFLPAAALSLNWLASLVSSSTFSGELATSTMHPLPLLLPPPDRPEVLHATSAKATARAGAV